MGSVWFDGLRETGRCTERGELRVTAPREEKAEELKVGRELLCARTLDF